MLFFGRSAILPTKSVRIAISKSVLCCFSRASSAKRIRASKNRSPRDFFRIGSVFYSPSQSVRSYPNDRRSGSESCRAPRRIGPLNRVPVRSSARISLRSIQAWQIQINAFGNIYASIEHVQPRSRWSNQDLTQFLEVVDKRLRRVGHH